VKEIDEDGREEREEEGEHEGQQAGDDEAQGNRGQEAGELTAGGPQAEAGERFEEGAGARRVPLTGGCAGGRREA
jgi:hypothetical protein